MTIDALPSFFPFPLESTYAGEHNIFEFLEVLAYCFFFYQRSFLPVTGFAGANTEMSDHFTGN